MPEHGAGEQRWNVRKCIPDWELVLEVQAAFWERSR